MDLGSTHSPSLSLLFSFFLLLTQNILYNTILYYILSYSQSKIFLLLTQNILYYIIYPLSQSKIFLLLTQNIYYIILYTPSPVKKINFSAVAAILRQFSPKLPQTPPFSPNLRHKKKFFWRLTPPKSQQNPTKSENEKKMTGRIRILYTILLLPPPLFSY